MQLIYRRQREWLERNEKLLLELLKQAIFVAEKLVVVLSFVVYLIYLALRAVYLVLGLIFQEPRSLVLRRGPHHPAVPTSAYDLEINNTTRLTAWKN